MATNVSLPLNQLNAIDCKQGAVRAVRFNADGDYCMTCGSDKSLKLWNPSKGSLLKTYSGHGYEVMDCCSSCDSSHIASGGMDKCVFVWDVSTGQPVRRYRAHAATINAIRFNEDSSVIISASVDGSVKLWDFKSKSKEPIQVLDEAKDSVSSVAVSDQQIVSASLDCAVRTYDIRKGIMNCDKTNAPVSSVCMTRDGQCLLISCLNNSIKLLDKSNGEVLALYSGHSNSKYRIDSCLIANDSVVLSGSEDGSVYCWDLIESNIIGKINHPSHRVVHSVSAHPSANTLLTATDYKIYFWSNQTLEKEDEL